jgi:hypothetical protein
MIVREHISDGLRGKSITVTCALSTCGRKFSRKPKDYNWNRKRGLAFFCSRECALQEGRKTESDKELV